MKTKWSWMAVVTAIGIGIGVTGGNAVAAGISLMCEEKKGVTERTTTMWVGLGQPEKKTEDSAIVELWKIPVTVDTSDIKGTVWGETRELSVEPEVLILRKSREETKSSGKTSEHSALKINRKTLVFTYNTSRITNDNLIHGRALLYSSTRKSEGICKKVVAVKGNQI